MRPEPTARLPADGGPHAVVVLPDDDTGAVGAENGGELYRVSLRTGEVETVRGGHGAPVNDLALAGGARRDFRTSPARTSRRRRARPMAGGR